MTGRRYVAGGKVAKSTPIRIRGLAVNCIKQQLCAVPLSTMKVYRRGSTTAISCQTSLHFALRTEALDLVE